MNTNGLSGCALIVVGAPRSGTSATALALRELGLYFGRDEDFGTPSDFNPDGFMEHLQFLRLNKNLDALYHGDGTGATIPPNWMEWPETPGVLQNAREFITEFSVGQEFWGWKDPRTVFMLPLYHEVFRQLGCQPHFIMPLRHPLDVAASWERIFHAPLSTSLSFWVSYVISALRSLQGADLCVYYYGEFLKDPRACLEPFIADLPIAPISEEAWNGVRSVVRPERSHGERTIEDLSGLEPDLISRLYVLALEIAHDREGYKIGKYGERIEGIWAEWSHLHELLDTNFRYAWLKAIWPDASGKQVASSSVFKATRAWIEGSIAISDPGEGRVGLRFTPSGTISFIRNLRFVTVQGENLRAEITPSGFGYLDQLPGGLIRVAGRAEGPHLFLKLPPRGVSGEFRFEIMIDHSVRSLTWVLQQTNGEIAHLRQSQAASNR